MRAFALLADEEGQGLVEYALIIFSVAIALVAALQVFGGGLVAQYQSFAAAIASL